MKEWWPEERVVRLLELHEQGLSMGKIALELGVTRNAVAGKIARLREYGQLAPAQKRQPKNRLSSRPHRIVLSPHRKLRRRVVAPIPRDSIVPVAIPFTKIEERQCRYILDEVRDGLAVFCGLATEHQHTSYCAGHEQVVYLWRAA